MNMSNHTISALESDLLTRFSIAYDNVKFPIIDEISLICRRSSPAGRVTYIKHEGLINIPNGPLYLGKFSQFNMIGLEHGASFCVQVENGKAIYLDISVNGDAMWDGQEISWTVCNPETGQT